MDYYLLLGVSNDADAETIRSAFRVLARRYHPDAGEGSSAEKFREVLAAYETLNDPTRRWRYDRALQAGPVRRSRFVEPLRQQAAPEPMLRRRREVSRRHLAYGSRGPQHVDELIDQLFQAWDDMFFGAPRRRNRT